MRLSHLVLPAALVFAFVAAPATASPAQKETEKVDRTVPFPSGGTLELKNFSGDIRITATNGRDVVISAVRRADRDHLDHIKLEISTSGSTVSINANKRDSSWNEDHDNVVETSFDIQVPASARLDLDAFSSDVDVTGITGEQDLHTFSGDVTVVGAKSPIKAKTFSGQIDIDATAAGTAPEVDAETFSGPIRYRLADGARGSVDFSSFSGSLDAGVPLTLHSSSRRSMKADLPGGSGSRLRFHTFSGDVRVVK
jgi:DUF4097 and DUF4098 domain-containing protein YvlB